MAKLESIERSIPAKIAPALPPIKDLSIFLALTAIASWLSLVGTAGHGAVATLWLTNGIVLGAMLTYPDRCWPALCLAAATGNIIGSMITGLPFGLTISYVTCNMIEVTAGLAILYKPGDPVEHFTERKSALRICSGVLAAPLASCVFAGLINCVFRHLSFLETCRLWYVAHALGLEIMTPLALAFRHNELHTVFSHKRRFQSAACLILLLAVTSTVFIQTSYPFLFMVFPPLVLAVFVLGFFGMSAGLFIVAMISLAFTLAGHGPFMLMHGVSLGERILTAQSFLLTSIIMTLPVAVALAERSRLEQRYISAQEQLRLLSFTDQLTGLSNRRLFDEFSTREWRRAVREQTSLSVIMIDIDMFKTYNDRYGHQSGDKCLAAVANAIGGIANRPGDLTARYGGEEFVVVLAGTPAQGCAFLAERIRKGVEALQLPHASSPMGKVTISLGMASEIPTDSSNFATLVEAADKALYEAKQRGRNNVATFTLQKTG